MKANIISIKAEISARNNPMFKVKFQDVKYDYMYTGYWLKDWNQTQINLSALLGQHITPYQVDYLYKLLTDKPEAETSLLNRFCMNPYEIQVCASNEVFGKMVASVQKCKECEDEIEKQINKEAGIESRKFTLTQHRG